MNFLEATKTMKEGKHIIRPGWEGIEGYNYLWMNGMGAVCASVGGGYSCPAFLTVIDILSDDWEVKA